MSGEGIKALYADIASAGPRPNRDHTEPNGSSIRGRAAAAARRVHDLSRTRADGVKFWGVGVGRGLPDVGQLENDGRYRKLVSVAHLDDGAINRGVVVPMPFFSTRLAVESSSDSAIGLGYVRSLDAISYSPKGVGRGMPPLLLALLMSVALLLINPSDYLGEIKGILAVLVPLGLWWLSQRSKRKAQEHKQQHETHEEAFRFSADKEKRLEERESKLRQEEREFMHQQITLSRERGHILVRGYMALEMANDRLIEILREKDIEVPPILLTQKTRAQVLGELKEVEDRQASIAEPKRSS